MKPDRIFLVRHGESQGNVNKEIYKDIPDYALKLTEKGTEQAKHVGKFLAEKISVEDGIQFYVSPFWRTRLTYLEIAKSFNCPAENLQYYEDPRIREQEWGQDMVSREGYSHERENDRDAYGHFYYRFPDGESCADVYDRVSDFMGTMFRDFEKENFPRNVIIVTHGMTMRLFIMRFFHASVEEFERWGNPKNCGHFFLELQSNDRYALNTPLRKHKLRHNYQFPINDVNKSYLKYPHKFDYELEPR